MKFSRILLTLFAVITASALNASDILRINEFNCNPPGSGVSDVGREYIELKSTQPFMNLDNIWVLVIEGDSEFGLGAVNAAINLTGLTTGSNGILLLRDSTIYDLLPAPDPASAVYKQENMFSVWGLGNDTLNILIVKNYDGVTADIDSDDDGVIDSTPWTEFIDGVSWTDGVENPPIADGVSYVKPFGGIDVPVTWREKAGDGAWEPDFFVRTDKWSYFCCDGTKSDPLYGPYTPLKSVTATVGGYPVGFVACNPGSDNMRVLDGDTNASGAVNIADLTNVLSDLTNAPHAPKTVYNDINSDNLVDDIDVMILASRFGDSL